MLALFAFIMSIQAGAEQSLEPIGPTPIMFYSGNLSVAEFMQYWGVGNAGQYSGASQEQNELLKRCSVQVMCDYPAWCLLEQEPGVWDWSFYRKNMEILASDGIGYTVFPWLHFPPKWFEDDPRFVRYENLHSGDTIPQLSLWAPFTLTLYDEFYRRLKDEFGQDVFPFIRLAMPSEYGEIGFSTGMTNWLRPQPHARTAYWCGDPEARKDFRRKMRARYWTLDSLNKAWATDYKAWEDVSLPDISLTKEYWLSTPQTRRRWLDFAEWYNGSWVRFIEDAVQIVRRYFPETELIISLGYGAEMLAFGNDEGRVIQRMSALGVSAQTPGDIGYFATRRVSSACRAYGVPYYTEPPGNVPPEREVVRIWMDASNGTQRWFDYPQNMDAARDEFRRYKRFLNAQPPQCGLALWYATSDQWLHTDRLWPEHTLAVADSLRDLADYEAMDDGMIASGGLDRLGVRTLALAQADFLDERALYSVIRWVEDGGTLVILGARSIPVVDGSFELWQRLVPPQGSGDPPFQQSRQVGQGTVYVLNTTGEAAEVADALWTVHAREHPDLLLPDGTSDGVWMTVMQDYVLAYNTSGQAVSVPANIHGNMKTLELAPAEIASIPLERMEN